MTRPRPDHAITVHAKVAFHECDPLGVVWHGNYFKWLELARTELLDSHDLEVPTIRGLGHRMFITDARCRYMAPLAYGDTLEIHAWFSAVSPLLRVAYDIENPATGRWSARAITVLATTDIDGELLPTTPDAILQRLPQL